MFFPNQCLSCTFRDYLQISLERSVCLWRKLIYFSIKSFYSSYFPQTYVMSKPQANLNWRRKEKRVWESLCESESEKWWLLVLVTASSKKVSTRVNIKIYTHKSTVHAPARTGDVDAHLLHVGYRCRGAFLFFEYPW